MNMQEATKRLASIIQKLGGSTSLVDQRELEALRDEMERSAGQSAPKASPRKRRATAEARKPKPEEKPAPAKKPAAAKKAKAS